MNTISLTSYSSSQQLHPLSLLAQVTSRKTTGCLQVMNGSTTWSIYLDQGNLIYATCSTDRLDRLDRHLSQLSRQVPALVSAIRVQVRLLFENTQPELGKYAPDYQAICWLVDQHYLEPQQAANLIEAISKEVVESLLTVREGIYEVIEREKFDKWVKFCQLDPRALVEHCQTQLRHHQSSSKPPGSRKALEPASDSGTRSPQTALENSLTLTPQRTSQPNPVSGKPLKEKYTIVCIDDSPTVLQAIKVFLDDISFSVVMVNDPVRALMQVIRSKPDLILMDVGMPNLDGYELCSLLRRNQALKAIPIIMVTGHTGFIDRAKAKLVGASGYLTKPFTQSELLKMVFKYLS